MGAAKPWGVVCLVAFVAVAVVAVLYLFGEVAALPAFVGDDATTTGYVVGAIAVALLLVGITLLMLKPKPAPPPPVVAAPVERVEIKRTEMNWGPRATASEAQKAQLDEINQRMGRLKVQYGMGELSREGYTQMMADLEKEKAQIERREHELRRI